MLLANIKSWCGETASVSSSSFFDTRGRVRRYAPCFPLTAYTPSNFPSLASCTASSNEYAWSVSVTNTTFFPFPSETTRIIFIHIFYHLSHCKNSPALFQLRGTGRATQKTAQRALRHSFISLC